MNVLAIETSTSVSGISIVNENKVLYECNINIGKTHSLTLMQSIEHMLKLVDVPIDYIACSSGPGSFTGLRIGAGTAKGLAHSLNKKIVNVSTLEAIAYTVKTEEKTIIVPTINARRNQVFTQFYKSENGINQPITKVMCIKNTEVLEMLKNYNCNKIFTGDGIDLFKGEKTCDIYLAYPKASNVGIVALEYIKENKNIESYKTFEPKYYKITQAERELK